MHRAQGQNIDYIGREDMSLGNYVNVKHLI